MTTNTPRGAKILVVEDDRQLADLYAAHLPDEYDVVVAYGGQEALNLLDETFDVVLLDRRMPVVSGNEVLASIRSEGLDCRVAMVTGATPDFDIVELQIDAYLVKPVSADELQTTVRRLLKLDTYNDRLQELSTKKLKRHVLEAEQSSDELEYSVEYQRLNEEIQELESEITALAYELDEPDETAVGRDTDSMPDDTPGNAGVSNPDGTDAGRHTDISRPGDSDTQKTSDGSGPENTSTRRARDVSNPEDTSTRRARDVSSPEDTDTRDITEIHRQSRNEGESERRDTGKSDRADAESRRHTDSDPERNVKISRYNEADTHDENEKRGQGKGGDGRESRESDGHKSQESGETSGESDEDGRYRDGR